MRIAVIGSFIQACCWLVKRLPKPGETLSAETLLVEPGGKGLNVAIGMRRLGAVVDVLLGIGSDAAGDALEALLKREGLSSEHVWRVGQKSGHGAGFIAADGQNAIAINSGPNTRLSDHHIRSFEPSLFKADIVYGQMETSLSAVTSAWHTHRTESFSLASPAAGVNGLQ